MGGKQGFASMDPAQQKEIASKGGRRAHEQGKAHEFTPEQARAAGALGGQLISRDREHMAAIGRRGGQRSAELAKQRVAQRKEAAAAAELTA